MAIKHNMAMTTAGNGISVDDIAAGAEIKWNTLAYDNDEPADANYSPTIRIDYENGTAAVENNATSGGLAGTDNAGTSAAATNNFTFAGTDDADHAAVLAGTLFGASDYADLDAFTTGMLPGSGESLDTADPKQGAGSYYTYDNTAAPAGSRSGLGTGLAAEPAGAYSPSATLFESGEYMNDATLTTSGPSGSKKLLISFGFEVVDTWPSTGQLFDMRDSGGNQRVYCNFASSGRLWFLVKNSGGTTISQFITSTSEFSVNTFYQVAFEIDTTTGTERGTMIKNGEVVSLGTGPSIVADGEIPVITRLYVAGTSGLSEDVALAELYINLAESLDLTVEGNREKFYADGNFVDLGSDGSTPTGTAPLMYYKNGFATFNEDESGNNNDLSVTGTLSDFTIT